MKKFYKELLKAAESARKDAYCPYSKFKVGAAVLTAGNKIFTGANVENASYGLSCCAERVAIFKAVTAGERNVKAVAVAGPGAATLTPCGACRQVINEFGKNTDIILSGVKIKVVKISKLLPEAFGGYNLGAKR